MLHDYQSHFQLTRLPSLTTLEADGHTRFCEVRLMTAKILDGTSVARSIKEEVGAEVAQYAKQDLRPGLAVVLVGNDTASEIYVSSKVKTCEQLGLYSEKITLPETT